MHRDVIGVTIVDAVVKHNAAPQLVEGYAINGNTIGGTTGGGYIYRLINGGGGAGLGAPARRDAASRMEDSAGDSYSEDIAGTASPDTIKVTGGATGL
ncbi:hypothetical protein ES703_112825 [subsurface metagenome]